MWRGYKKECWWCLKHERMKWHLQIWDRVIPYNHTELTTFKSVRLTEVAFRHFAISCFKKRPRMSTFTSQRIIAVMWLVTITSGVHGQPLVVSQWNAPEDCPRSTNILSNNREAALDSKSRATNKRLKLKRQTVSSFYNFFPLTWVARSNINPDS